MNDNMVQDANLRELLQKDGVVKIPFLTPDELVCLQTFYHEMHGKDNPPSLHHGIHMTIWHHDTAYKLKIKNRISEILREASDRVFQDYRAINHQFIVKIGGNETTFPVHQDWSVVDENLYGSLNIWIPLLDVDETNGAMWIVKGTHKTGRKIRGAGYLFPNYHPVLDSLKPYMTSFPMKAGEALLFYHSTIHGSPLNGGDCERAVVQASILPKEAPLQIYFQKDAGSPLEVHFPEDDFSYYYKNIREDSQTSGPTGPPAKLLPPLAVHEITINDLRPAIQPGQAKKSRIRVLRELIFGQ